jgi:polyhydroxyalkanoate synthase
MSEATAVADGDDLWTTLRREIDRNALRAKNGIKYLAGSRFVRTGVTPRDLVWKQGKAELWRYRSDRRIHRPPLLMYVGLVGRAYAFDLYPGNSFVQKMMNQGFDTYVLDWGVPDEAEAQNTIANYTHDMLPRAVDALLEASGDDELSILGYCMGGCLTLGALGCGVDLPLRSLILMAVPTDFTKMGPFFDPIREGSIDLDMLLDDTGNVPASLIRSSFRVRKPTSELVVYANLWQNLWNDEYMEAFQAFNEWANDAVPFPGAAFRDFANDWLLPNGVINTTLAIRGKRIDLGRIRVPVLCIIAEKDDIVPVACAEPLPTQLTGADVTTVRLPAGHVNLVTGKPADKVTIPAIVQFLTKHAKGADAA